MTHLFSLPTWLHSPPPKTSSSPRKCFRRLRGESLEDRRLLAFDPTPLEQAFFESVNRMRIDPQGELEILFSSLDPLRARENETQGAIQFFNVDSTILQQQWATLTPVSPVAWNEKLIASARTHTELMLQFDMQAHDLPGEPGLAQRIRNAGYDFARASENIYAFAENHIHGHAGFVVDWGEGPGGIQDPAGHRNNYMDARVSELGISVIEEFNPATSVGPILITQHFGQPKASQSGNPFVLGVVWRDGNFNEIYDPGEGIGGVNIRVTGPAGTFETVTMSAGGYQVRVPNGTYEVIASGTGIPSTYTVGNVVVTGENRKADFETSSSNTPPVAVSDRRATPEDTSITIRVADNDSDSDGSIDPTSVRLVSGPSNGTASVNADGTIRYSPRLDFSGTDVLTYSIRDQQGATSNSATVTISVTAVNDAPLAGDISVSVPRGTATQINLTSSIVDVDSAVNFASLAVVSSPQHGTISRVGSTGAFLYTPSSGYSGPDEFTYRVSDQEGAQSNIARVTLQVGSSNANPVASADSFVVIQGTPKLLDVKKNDVDSDDAMASVVLLITSQPANGAASILNGQINYVASASFQGRDSFQYRLRDPDGAFSNIVEVTLTVTSALVPWQNPIEPKDVDGKNGITPLDALLVINYLNVDLTKPGGLPTALQQGPAPFLDVTGDNLVTPRDALLVINSLSPSGSRPTNGSVVTSRDSMDQNDMIMSLIGGPLIPDPASPPKDKYQDGSQESHQAQGIQIAEGPAQFGHIPGVRGVEIHPEDSRDEAQGHEDRGDNRQHLHDFIHANAGHRKVVVPQIRADVVVDFQHFEDLDRVIIAIAEEHARSVGDHWVWIAN